MKLRDYQIEAINKTYDFLRNRKGNPCIVIPTGGGKTPVFVQMAKDAAAYNRRVLILAHVKELLEQTIKSLEIMAPELSMNIGIHSAGLGSRDTKQSIVVAGIQSAYSRAEEFGHIDLIIIDEAHMIPPEGYGMYRTLLEKLTQVNPYIRIVGLTATPYRLSSGEICSQENFLNEICYEVGVKELIHSGYLCPLTSKAGIYRPESFDLHVRAGEFIQSEVENLMDREEMISNQVKEIIEYTKEKTSVLIFTAGVSHGLHVTAELLRAGQCALNIFGDTPDDDRADRIRMFRERGLKYLVNVNVLTTGFDAPNVDCVVLLRPTKSPGLYYQMVGRGFRLCDGKSSCLVLDYGNNILRHGPIDAIKITKQNGNGSDAPAKECPNCHSVIHAAYGTCPDCGYVFPKKQIELSQNHSGASIISGEEEEFSVLDIYYTKHIKHNAPSDVPKTLRVEYQVGFNQFISEWICFEHQGWAREKAKEWWRRRSNAPIPSSVDDALDMIDSGALASTSKITAAKQSNGFYKILTYFIREIPVWEKQIG